MSTRQRGSIYLVAIVGLLITLIFGTGVLNAEPMGTAQIAAPENNARITGNVQINGTAVVQNFQFYKLEFAMANSGFATIGDLVKTPVTNGLLGTWDTTKVPDGTYMLRLTVVDMSGNFLTNQITVMVGNNTPAPAPELPRRGCTACHALENLPIQPPGAFTLAWEANVATKALLGIDHPVVSPSGVSIKTTDQTNPEPCLECHRPGTGAREFNGVIANKSLRDIVHPAHLFSDIFVPEFKGNCFSCHNPGPNGEWYVLYDAVDVYENGMSKITPIPGQHLPF